MWEEDGGGKELFASVLAMASCFLDFFQLTLDQKVVGFFKGVSSMPVIDLTKILR